MSTADIDIAGCRYVVLSGGVGGAKLAQGLSLCRPAEELLVVGNIGDDFEHWGLHISPDLDTLMYTLAGVANPELGWGRAAETWHVLEAVSELGGETWFRLGDRDLAVAYRALDASQDRRPPVVGYGRSVSRVWC